MSGGCQSFPHSPTSVPTSFDIDSETELIQGNVSRHEPFPSGSHRDIYQSQYRNWYREAKEEEWEICTRLWKGAMSSHLHIKSFLGNKNTIEILGGGSPLYCKDKVKKMKNWLKNQGFLSIDQKKELEVTPFLEKEGPVASISSKPAPEVSKCKM
ncbi:hypothetical protein O181_130698 [Austropuccinia psidii MF-1]|uniref:Uncharacterized protein n=1 Tax=Austropuccinia psidii MF-1 TaxID=1389203 RepID=A0A9Q3KZ58_9BASI|nr:hypothetical protein [Austropuccinia psidii MF-1]